MLEDAQPVLVILFNVINTSQKRLSAFDMFVGDISECGGCEVVLFSDQCLLCLGMNTDKV